MKAENNIYKSARVTDWFAVFTAKKGRLLREKKTYGRHTGNMHSGRNSSWSYRTCGVAFQYNAAHQNMLRWVVSEPYCERGDSETPSRCGRRTKTNVITHASLCDEC